MGDQPLGIYWAVEVGQLAGVSRRTVGQWARHGYIRSSRSTTSPRVYSFQDVAEAIVVHELIARGVPYREVRRTIDNTRDEYGDWPLTAAPLATTVHAPGHGPASVLLHLREADLDVGRHHGGQAVLRYSTLAAVTQLLRRGGWAILRGLEGKWVALKVGKVVAAADSPGALFKRLRSKRIRDASVLRVPTEQEHQTELVGIG